MPPPHVLRLGRVLLEGERMSFEREPGEIEAAAGRETILVVAYRVVEASSRREEVDLVVTTELDGHTSKQESVVLMTDRPVVTDVAEGEVRHAVRFPWRGSAPVRVTVEARRREGPWSGQGAFESATWRHIEERVVKVT